MVRKILVFLHIPITSAFFSSQALAQEMHFFEGPINFWNQNDNKQKEKSFLPENRKEVKSKAKFDWTKQLDPKNDVFFKEGDYVPPEPFMELVRNPTDQNIKMWFAYQDKKNALAQRLASRMQEYLEKNNPSLSKEAKGAINNKIDRINLSEEDFGRYRFRMYFDSTCPHCKKMFATLNDLQDRGYLVEARQLDRGSLQDIKSLVPIIPASQEEIRRFNINAVPLLVAGDMKKKTIFRQTGFVTPDEVLAILRSK